MGVLRSVSNLDERGLEAMGTDTKQWIYLFDNWGRAQVLHSLLKFPRDGGRGFLA